MVGWTDVSDVVIPVMVLRRLTCLRALGSPRCSLDLMPTRDRVVLRVNTYAKGGTSLVRIMSVGSPSEELNNLISKVLGLHLSTPDMTTRLVRHGIALCILDFGGRVSPGACRGLSALCQFGRQPGTLPVPGSDWSQVNCRRRQQEWGCSLPVGLALGGERAQVVLIILLFKFLDVQVNRVDLFNQAHGHANCCVVDEQGWRMLIWLRQGPRDCDTSVSRSEWRVTGCQHQEISTDCHQVAAVGDWEWELGQDCSGVVFVVKGVSMMQPPCRCPNLTVLVMLKEYM
eukprot:2431658-Amphidinium_carterae.8